MKSSEDRTGRQAFEVRTFREGGSWRLALCGELDLASADQLEDAIRMAEEGSGLRIVVDLGDLRFIDSTGLNVLLNAQARSRKNGQRLSFKPSRHEAVIRLLDLTQTTEILAPH
jgi:anti-sigma B factor antagonist